nr:UDP-N-acetylmuramoyl-tripeptide--D-alanyl-D-alanine ligase [Microbulbifer sediminum]
MQQLQNRFGGELVNGSVEFAQVCTDTRRLDANAIFVALVGETFDAHEFAADLDGKVLGLVVEHQIEGCGLPQWVVRDTTIALGQIGRLCREQFKGPVLAITGSCGKTTVKQMLAAIFGQRHTPCVTQGNLNNQFGVPMTLFGLSAEHDVLILEMGANGPDDIGYLCGIGLPQVTAVNNVKPAHVEGFGSVAGIAAAKGQIYTSLEPGSTAVINTDDDFADFWLRNMPDDVETLNVGLGRDCAVFAENIEVGADACPSFDLVIEGVTHRVQLKLMGEHNVHNALVAAGCAFAAGIPAKEIASGLELAGGVAGRLQMLRGRAGETVIDDSYNANPGSVAAAINLLAQRPGRKILVLGDMAELGADAEAMHREVGELAANRGLDGLYTFGPLGAAATEAFAAVSGDNAHNFSERARLVAALERDLTKETTVLVKGSRSARMEEVVQALTQTGDGEGDN